MDTLGRSTANEQVLVEGGQRANGEYTRGWDRCCIAAVYEARRKTVYPRDRTCCGDVESYVA